MQYALFIIKNGEHVLIYVENKLEVAQAGADYLRATGYEVALFTRKI